MKSLHACVALAQNIHTTHAYPLFHIPSFSVISQHNKKNLCSKLIFESTSIHILDMYCLFNKSLTIM